MPKWETLRCQKGNISLYLLQNMSFRRFRNLIKNGCKKGCKNDLKIDLWALGGRIFEILGGFLRGLIFDEFSIGKKSAKNRENGGPWLLKAKFIDIWGGVGGKGGGHGRLLESDKSLTRVCNDFQTPMPREWGRRISRRSLMPPTPEKMWKSNGFPARSRVCGGYRKEFHTGGLKIR